MALVAASASVGCAARGNTDLLESRLRQQEDMLRDMEAQLAQSRAELQTAGRETLALREQVGGRVQQVLLPEQTHSIARAEGIQINTLRSGGLDYDDAPGDDLLSAVVVPTDAQGETVKLPGELEIEVFDLAQSGERRIGHWKFNAQDTAAAWHSSFIGSGYLFKLPWQTVPARSDLLLHAKLTTPDGRQFDASENIRVTPPAGAGSVQPPRYAQSPTIPTIPATQVAATTTAAPGASASQTTYVRKVDAAPEPEGRATLPAPTVTSDRWTKFEDGARYQ